MPPPPPAESIAKKIRRKSGRGNHKQTYAVAAATAVGGGGGGSGGTCHARQSVFVLINDLKVVEKLSSFRSVLDGGGGDGGGAGDLRGVDTARWWWCRASRVGRR